MNQRDKKVCPTIRKGLATPLVACMLHPLHAYYLDNVSYKLFSSCNIGTSGLPDMYTRGPQGVHIRQTTSAHVTTIM